MALNIKDATYGRDSSGRKKLLSDLLDDISTAIKTIETESKTVTDSVDKYWLGEDANKFKSKFKTSTMELATLYKKYKATVQNALADDSKQFEKFQSTNASNIAGKVTSIK